VRRPVELHIERLALPPGLAGEPIRLELERLLAQERIAARSATVGSVRADLGGPPTPAGIARAVHDGIGRCST
jgi:hypothetical protein